MKYVIVKVLVACTAIMILLPVKAQQQDVTDTDNGQVTAIHQPSTLDGMQGVFNNTAENLAADQNDATETLDADDSDTQSGDDNESGENEPQRMVRRR